jgi:predicted RNase H-like nuclease (RuvC/YqgF family)
MRALVLGLAANFVLPLTASQAQDSSCFASFKVKDNKSVVLDLLPGGTVAQVASCPASENLRANYYIKHHAYLDTVSNGTSTYYVSELEKSIAALGTKVDELDAKIKNNENLSALQIVAEVVFYEAVKVDTFASCTKRPKSVSCALGFVGLITSTYSIATGDIAKNKFAEVVAKQKAELVQHRARLAQLKANVGAINMTEVKADIQDTFFGMCRAIKRDCLD